MNRISLPILGLALILLVACDSASGADGASSQSVQPTSPVVTTQPEPDPLEGEWHQEFACEENIRTFQSNLSESTPEERRALATLKGNNDTSVQSLLEEYTREFAWGPSAQGPIHGALTAAQIKPNVICEGAPDRERTIRFVQGSLVIEDWDGLTMGPAVYEFVSDHTITVNDGGSNFGCCPEDPLDTFSFRVDGDVLVFTQVSHDAWGGTVLEVSPWHRLS